MKLKTTVLMLVMMSALILTTFNGSQVALGGPVVPAPNGPYGSWDKYGPRVDKLIFYVAGSVKTEADDFEAGKMDVMDWAAPAERTLTWLADPEITMGEMEEFGPIYLALNTMRWPLGHGDQFPEGWASYPSGYLSNHDPSLWSGPDAAKSDYPVGTADMTWIDYNCQRCLDSRWFRRGLAHMVDRVSQVAHMSPGGVALDPSLFWPSMKAWEHPNVTEIYDQAGYITKYAYDLAKARQCFERGGFKDWDNDNVMEYSPTHDGSTKEELPNLLFYTREDDEHRTFAGQMMDRDMTLLQIPHTLNIATYGTVATQVWALYDYDIYIEYWAPWDPLPNNYSEWFMSSADIYPDPWGNNEHRYHSKEFDVWADLFTKVTSAEEARPYCYKMQEFIHRDVPAIPFYSYVGYNARKTHYGTWTGEEKYAGRAWEGMCNFPGEGFYTYTGAWTPLNAHPQGFEKGGTLRQGLNVDAEMLDIMDGIYFYDILVLRQIYERLVKFNPWDLSKFEPWLCESYKVGTWQHPTLGTASAINFTLIPGILWQDGRPMTAADVAFTFNFTKACKSINYMYVKDFDSSKVYTDPVTKKETIEIRFKVRSWMALYWTQGVPIIPKHIWEPVTAKGSAAWIPEDHDAVIGTGPFRFYKDGVVGRVNRVPGEYLYLEPNPLYFRKYIWPDVCDQTYTAGVRDQIVRIADDFMAVAMPGNIFAREKYDGTWPGTYDPVTNPTGTRPGAWGPYADVNQDGKIGVGDLMEIGVHWLETWPPPWYLWS